MLMLYFSSYYEVVSQWHAPAGLSEPTYLCKELFHDLGSVVYSEDDVLDTSGDESVDLMDNHGLVAEFNKRLGQRQSLLSKSWSATSCASEKGDNWLQRTRGRRRVPKPPTRMSPGKVGQHDAVRRYPAAQRLKARAECAYPSCWVVIARRLVLEGGVMDDLVMRLASAKGDQQARGGVEARFRGRC